MRLKAERSLSSIVRTGMSGMYTMSEFIAESES